MKPSSPASCSRPVRWIWAALLWGCLGAFGPERGTDGGPRTARADDEPESSAPSPEEPLLWQHFDVGLLTAERTDFRGPRGPFPTPSDRLGDEEPHPPSVTEDGSKPFGSVTDVIDLVRLAVPDAEWKRTGTRVDERGRSLLRARAPKATLARIEMELLELEREATRTATLDAVVLRGDPSTAVGPQGLAEAVARGALEPLVGARVTGMQDEVVAARTGGERAHLAEHDVKVTIDSKGIDPIVGVLLDGLAVRVKLASVTDSRARGILQAWWAAPAQLLPHRSPVGDVLERPVVDGRSWSQNFDVVPGAWTLLPSTSGISLAIRMTVTRRAASAPGPGALKALALGREAGPLEVHRWDVADLGDRIQHFRGSALLRLDPSNFSPPEPPELPEPTPVFPGEDLLDVLRFTVGEAALAREGASLRLAYGTLWGSLDRESAAGIDSCLAAIRARYLVMTRLRATGVALPLASFPEYLAGLDDGAALLAEGGEALFRRPGARVIDRCALRLQRGQRGAIVGGTQHSYVADYDIKIAEKSVIGDPVVRAWLEGLSLDLLAERSLAADSVWCVMRLERSTERETRQVPTPYGPIDCPSIGVQRVSGAFALPVGGSRIVAAHLEGGVVTLVIVSVARE